MNKMLKISLIAVMAVVSPLMANAAVTDADPGQTVVLDNAPKAANNPGWGLAQANAQKDGNVATAGYVKGAYNAAIKAINTVAAKVDEIDSGIEGAIENAKVTYTPSGTVGNSSLTVVNEWGTDGTDNITITGGTFTGTEDTVAVYIPEEQGEGEGD